MILHSTDERELLVECECRCMEGLRITLDKWGNDKYALLTYTKAVLRNGNGLLCKLKKMWSILTNKDYCYSEILCSKQDLITLCTYINKYIDTCTEEENT